MEPPCQKIQALHLDIVWKRKNIAIYFVFCRFCTIFAPKEDAIVSMNIDKLIDKFFGREAASVSIEVFDDSNIYQVYSDIVKMLNDYPEIELSVLQGMAYCFYELLDNVLVHSGKKVGTVVLHYDEKSTRVKILVVDDGVGVKTSLAENPDYKDVSEEDALKLCLQNSVTDGKGMGYGLFSTMQLIRNAGSVLQIHSGSHRLSFNGKDTSTIETEYWQGTIVYFELHSDKVINPKDVFEGRADIEGGYDQLFEEEDGLGKLW
jgi:hypothetical protein